MIYSYHELIANNIWLGKYLIWTAIAQCIGLRLSSLGPRFKSQSHILRVLMYSFFKKNGPNLASFCLFLFFSHDKYTTNTINEKA